MKLKAVLLAALSFVLVACSSPDFSTAEAKVSDLHQALDSEQYDSIYQDGSTELKSAISQADFVRFLTVVHKKLGLVQSSANTFKGFSVTTKGTFLSLNYKTVFARGDAQEQFVYVMRDHQILLAGYHVNSMALIEN